MKNKIIVAALGMMMVAFGVQGKIWRVNNNVGVAADFTTLQAAHDGALANDTISLESSATSYGTLTATKKLIIIGQGYFHNQNYPTYPIVNSATIGNTTLSTGSSGTQIIGITNTSNLITINVSDVSIGRITGGTITIGANVSNILITQNYSIFVNGGTATNSTNILVANNHISQANFVATAQASILNNIFNGGSDSNFNSQVISNNIIYSQSGINVTNCTVTNNIDAGSNIGGLFTRFGTTNGNIGNLSYAQVFVGATGNSTDGQWKLKTGSPAIGAGVSGVDCGMYGGSTPYQLSGLPAVPAFTKITTSTVGSNTTPLQVTVTVESKN